MTRVSSDSTADLAKWEVQLRKGVLEFVILLALERKEQYGFELISGILSQASFELSEGTLYPLLLRLSRDGLVTSRLAGGDGGAPRKYYTLSPTGGETVAAMTVSWRKLAVGVEQMIAGER
jgi:PadR family transcriptional regulator, regulatory protein PadR